MAFELAIQHVDGDVHVLDDLKIVHPNADKIGAVLEGVPETVTRSDRTGGQDFEGNPRLIPYIHEVHHANGCTNVEVNNALLGPRKGQVDFIIRKNILASSMEVVPGRPGIEIAKVQVRNAKYEFARIKPTVLICDIEGSEADLIPALPLDDLRCAILELHPQWIGPQGINKVFQAFINAGMAYYPRFSTHKVVCFRRDWHVT